MDILTVRASAVHSRGEGEQECLARLLEHLGAQRRKYAKRLYAEIRRRRPASRKGLKRTPTILTNRIKENNDRSKVSGVTAHATATAVRLATQLAEPQRLGKENLHPYRLRVKNLRNVLRMAARADSLKFVDDLGQLKDAIGEWHDWEELVSIAEKVLSHGNRCELLSKLKRSAKDKYENSLALAQKLRQTYFRNPSGPKQGASSAPKIPSEPVWTAIALLAA